MASPTRPSPPPVPPAAAVSRRPFYTRWWYDPVQRRRVIIATVLALLYGSGLAYGSGERGGAAGPRPSTTRVESPPRRKCPLPATKEQPPHSRVDTALGHRRP